MNRRTTAALLVGCYLMTTACTETEDAAEPNPAPEATETVADLTAGLESFDLSGLTFGRVSRARAAAGLSTAVDGLGDLRPTVTAGDISQGDATASAELAYAWDLDADGEDDWTYGTTADLTRIDDDWHVQWTPSLLAPELRTDEVLVVSELMPERAQLLGAGGSVLVRERPVQRIGVDKTQVSPDRAVTSARALAQALGVDAAGFAAQVQASGPEAFVEAVVLRTEDLTGAEQTRITRIAGALIVEDSLPLAPTAEFARPVLGSVGAATAELIEESEGRLSVGDLTGLFGLQERYDEQLTGTVGMSVTAQSTSGDSEDRELFVREPVPGQPVRTTIHIGLQNRAERVLSPTTSPSALVAIQPSTGYVLAVASGPAGDGLSTATDGRFAPGSTFKVVSTLALLRSGLTTSTPLPCTPTVVVDGKEFGNYSDYPATDLGDIPLRTAVASSCNTAFVASLGAASQADLATAAASLGLGIDQDLGSPAFLGSVPDTAGDTEHAASMIGQGRIEASPLAMATVAASVQAGRTVVPRLVLEPPTAAANRPGRPLDPDEASELRVMMQAAVTQGSANFLADVPGPALGAKTGTAEYGTDVPLRTHAWMIAYQGDLAVAVMVQDGESGSATAGPLLEAFLRSP
ncbi:MAG: penicillin-binding transpeptidase domain-containing protein [Actinomycetota bacterium]|nr:penicillin-binding transpeptidase domain-containing protein [Actinomycetota bacterium]